MRGAAIDTVDAEQLELVLTVEGDEIIVEEALLRHLIFVGNAVEVQTRTEVVLFALEGFDVICVILLQEDRGLCWGALLAHACVRVGRVGQGFAFFAIGHELIFNLIIISNLCGAH